MATRKVDIKLGLTGAQQVEAGLKEISKKLATITGAAAKMTVGLVGIGSSLTVGGFIAGIKAAADLGSHLSDVADRVDMTAGEVLVLQQSFKIAGLDAGLLQTTIGQLNKSIDEARHGNKTYADSFERIGVNLQKLYAMRPAERFRTIQEALNGLNDSADRTAVAMRLFGRQGQQLLNLSTNDIKEAERILGSLPEVMTRNAAVFDHISDSIGNMNVKSQQFFSGVLDLVEPTLTSFLDRFNGYDFTPMGRNIGASINVGIQMIQDGQIPRLIELVFQAGFARVRGLWIPVVQFMGSSTSDVFQYTVTSILVQTAKLFTDFLNNLSSQTITWGLAIWFYVSDVAAAKIKEYLAKIPGADMLGITAPVPDWETSFADAMNSSSNLVGDNYLGLGSVSKWLDEVQQGLDQNLNLELGIDPTKWDRELADFIAQEKAKADQKTIDIPVRPILSTPPAGTSTADIWRNYEEREKEARISENEKKLITSQTELNRLKVEYVGFETKLEAISNQRAVNEQNWQGTQIQKYNQKVSLLAQESVAYEDQIKSLQLQNDEIQKQIELKRQAILDLKPEEREKKEPTLNKEIQTLETEKAQNEKKIGGIQNKQKLNQASVGPDPYSFGDQIQKNLNKVQDGFGTLQEQVGNFSGTMATSLETSLGGALTNILMQTEDIDEAFAKMGQTLLTSMVTSLMGIVAKVAVLTAIILPLNILTGGAIGAILKLAASFVPGFATGGRVYGGRQIIQTNENGSEFVVSAKSPRTNDKWLSLANKGFNIDDYMMSGPSSTQVVQNENNVQSGGKTVTVRTNAELRNEWKRGGIVEVVREGFLKRGWA